MAVIGSNLGVKKWQLSATFGKHSELLKWETDNLIKPENGNNENLIKPNNENMTKHNIWIKLLLLKEADNNNNVMLN